MSETLIYASSNALSTTLLICYLIVPIADLDPLAGTQWQRAVMASLRAVKQKDRQLHHRPKRTPNPRQNTLHRQTVPMRRAFGRQ